MDSDIKKALHRKYPDQSEIRAELEAYKKVQDCQCSTQAHATIHYVPTDVTLLFKDGGLLGLTNFRFSMIQYSMMKGKMNTEHVVQSYY